MSAIKVVQIGGHSLNHILNAPAGFVVDFHRMLLSTSSWIVEKCILGLVSGGPGSKAEGAEGTTVEAHRTHEDSLRPFAHV